MTENMIEQIVEQMRERFNMAIAMALDDTYDFDRAVGLFDETVKALEMYHCGETAAEQQMNFAQIAFYKEHWAQALHYTEEAQAHAEKAKQLLHDMAYRLLETGLQRNGDVELLDLAANYLKAEDYVSAVSMVEMSEQNDFAAHQFYRQLGMEMVRQGISRERKGKWEEALQLFRGALPALNPKRAELIRQEISNVERRMSHA